MELNTDKCKPMRVTQSTCESQTYYLNDTRLEIVPSYKYLGVHITTDLTWTAKIVYVTNNAKKALEYFRGNISHAPLRPKR